MRAACSGQAKGPCEDTAAKRLQQENLLQEMWAQRRTGGFQGRRTLAEQWAAKRRIADRECRGEWIRGKLAGRFRWIHRPQSQVDAVGFLAILTGGVPSITRVIAGSEPAGDSVVVKPMAGTHVLFARRQGMRVVPAAAEQPVRGDDQSGKYLEPHSA